ncbi:MAG: hypothetical protein U5L76_01980 [Patescibacteria group bacterium]|nr:hypothetical protein [Patescibacteria group bacterium]
MTLSPEEKQKISEEEKYRSEQRKKHEKKKKSSSAIGCLVIIIILVIVGFVSCSGDNDQNNSTSTTTTTTSDSMAFVIAKGFVRDSLKSPSSADFPILDFVSTSLGENRYQVTSHVDAENSFGVMIRSDWVATLKYLEGDDADQNNWELEKLIIDDETIYESLTNDLVE